MKLFIGSVVVLGVGALGFYLGTQYALGQVKAGVLGGVDKGLNAVGLNVNGDYGRAAHNIVDATLGQILQ